MLKKTLLIGIIFTLALLVACNNNIVDEAKKIKEESQEEEKKKIEQKQSQQDYVIEEGSTIEEVKEKIKQQREEKETEPVKSVEDKESFTDPDEFSQYIAKVLYGFETQEIDAETYYNFLINHGSRVFLMEIDNSEKNTIISGYSKLQEILTQDTNYTGYKISKLTYDEPEIYGYFYRSVQTEEGEINYKTTIVKEGKEWKFDSDNLSPGYNEKRKEGNK